MLDKLKGSAVLLACALAGAAAAGTVATLSTRHVESLDSPLPLPASVAEAILVENPDRERVILLAPRACGTPFATTLNYLTAMARAGSKALVGSTIVTTTRRAALMRELSDRSGVEVVANDELLASTEPYGDVIILGRRKTGSLFVRQVGLSAPGEIVEAVAAAVP